MAKVENAPDLPKYVMINPRYAAMWEDDLSGIKLNKFAPDNIYAKVPTDRDCSRVMAAIAIGRLLKLDKPEDRVKHMRDAKVEMPIVMPTEEQKVQLREILKPRNLDIVLNSIRTIRDVKTLSWLLWMEVEKDNTLGMVRGGVIDVIKSQINMIRGPALLQVEPEPEPETETV